MAVEEAPGVAELKSALSREALEEAARKGLVTRRSAAALASKLSKSCGEAARWLFSRYPIGAREADRIARALSTHMFPSVGYVAACAEFLPLTPAEHRQLLAALLRGLNFHILSAFRIAADRSLFRPAAIPAADYPLLRRAYLRLSKASKDWSMPALPKLSASAWQPAGRCPLLEAPMALAATGALGPIKLLPKDLGPFLLSPRVLGEAEDDLRSTAWYLDNLERREGWRCLQALTARDKYLGTAGLAALMWRYRKGPLSPLPAADTPGAGL